MTDEMNDFTHIAVKRETRLKTAILAKVLDGTNMYSLVEYWADLEWKTAREAGLVTDAMIRPSTALRAKNEKRAAAA